MDFPSVTQSRVINGEEGGMVVGECGGSVAECCWLKPEAWVQLLEAPFFFLSLCGFKSL